MKSYGGQLSVIIRSYALYNMYTIQNYKTKKAFKEALLRGDKIELYSPGIGTPKENGTEFVEGPHYPTPHSWYAQVEVKDYLVTRIK